MRTKKNGLERLAPHIEEELEELGVEPRDVLPLMRRFRVSALDAAHAVRELDDVRSRRDSII